MGCKRLLQWGAEICEYRDLQSPGTSFCCFLLPRGSVGPQARGCSSPCMLHTWAHGLVKLFAAQRRGCIIFPRACQYWAALKDSASALLLSSEVNTEYFWSSKGGQETLMVTSVKLLSCRHSLQQPTLWGKVKCLHKAFHTYKLLTVAEFNICELTVSL